MKKSMLFLAVIFLFTVTQAQENPDSAAYQAQRKKINHMLALRAEKFGQYSESLDQHTGIFGLQTKKDIRRSNDILTDIIKTDDDIYKQLKILLDYRAFQQTQVQEKSKTVEVNTTGFINAINNLRAENERLKTQADEADKSYENTKRYLIIAIVLMGASILLLLRRKYTAKA